MSGGAKSPARPRGRAGRAVALVAIAAAIAGLFLVQLTGGGKLPEGAVAPAFSLPRADRAGERVELALLRGKVVVLDFWSTTCPPCLAEMDELETLRRRMGPRGVEVVGICAGGEPVDEVARFVRGRGVSYPIAVDEDGVAAAAYRVRSLPTLYVVDAAGRVTAGHSGFWAEDDIAAAVADALAAPGANR
ncbi:MAG: TlpA family protein disulfide reductase [Proteobacteria bacterium]|jgi:peroxiredoxin|nr:TlpA family protein disulfide reductase [Pseudomonadota bacterium]